MNENSRLQLEDKLRKMLAHLDETQNKKERPIASTGTGNYILRRSGEKDKRL